MRAAAAGLLLVLAAAPSRAGEGCLWLQAPRVLVERVQDTETGALCDGEGRLGFTLCADASVSLTVAGLPVAASTDGAPVALVSDVTLRAGHHRIVLDASSAGHQPFETRPFELRAAFAEPSRRPETAAGELAVDIANLPVQRVGRTFVAGVDLFDGHLTRQATDLQLEGRHQGLELTRRYSSAGLGGSSPLGSGWTFNYAADLRVAPGCGLVVVGTPDGGSQTFRTLPDDRGFRPQRGYHTRLARHADGSFDFVDKSARRHRYVPFPGGGARLRLAYIEEPHGDRIRLSYDGEGRLIEAAEVQRAGAAIRIVARSLVFAYSTVAGAKRLRSVQAAGLGLSVRYDYDERGRLIAATREDEDLAGAESERYEYSADIRDPGQLVALRAAAGERTRYRYGPAASAFPGLGSPASPSRWSGSREFVFEVTELPVVKRAGLVTRFEYDHSRADGGVFVARVREDAGSPTIYTLNSDGSPVESDEPRDGGGRLVTRTRWVTGDIYKLGEQNDQGYEATWEHDKQGNLTRERSRQKASAPFAETTYSYHPVFNTLTSKLEPDGKLTRYAIDDRTGDLLAKIEPDGTTERYVYDDEGRQIATIAPGGGRTEYAQHDSYGRASLVIGPDGRRGWFFYDLRGRRIEPDEPPATAATPAR